MNPLLLKYNKTTKLIMPMAFYLRKDIKGDKIVSDDNFIGSYVGDINEPEFDDKIMLVWKDLEEVYEVPEQFQEDYWNIISSGYSKISDGYKEVLLKFWGETHASEFFKLLNADAVEVSPETEMKKGMVRSKLKEHIGEFDLFEEVYNMGVLV